MFAKDKNPKSKATRRRLYEEDVMALQALRLIAAPNPQDDLTDEELAMYFKKHKFSPEMIQQIVETVKSL